MYNSPHKAALHSIMHDSDMRDGEALKKHSPKVKMLMVEHHGIANAASPEGKDMEDEPIVAIMERLMGKHENPAEEGTPEDEADDAKLKAMAMHMKGK